MGRRAAIIARLIAKDARSLVVVREGRSAYHGGSRPDNPANTTITARIGDAGSDLAQFAATVAGAVRQESGWVLLADASAPFVPGEDVSATQTINAPPLGKFQVRECQAITEWGATEGWLARLDRLGPAT